MTMRIACGVCGSHVDVFDPRPHKCKKDKTMKPHKHAELIKAWADGAEIQVKYTDDPQYWVDKNYPSWHPDDQYRIKPEPKPDDSWLYVAHNREVSLFKISTHSTPNLKLTFDGETGELKSAEVLK